MMKISALEISIISCIYIILILIVRKVLNNKSFKHASTMLWGMVCLRLIFPYSIIIPLNRINTRGIVNKIANTVIDSIISFNRFKDIYLIDNINNFFPKLNRALIILFLGGYIVFKIHKSTKVLSQSLIIDNNKYINDFLRNNKLKRKVHVFVNDDLKYPITHGIIKPKIVIQSQLIEDRNMLKYVLVHEMIHIKKFDVLWNHLKCILICIYWYNPFVWLMGIYLNEDMEILCDKLVIDKTGKNEENKKNYCIAMLNLITEKEKKDILGFKLHPNMERMMILKNWRIKKAGILLATLMFFITSTIFVSADERVLPVTMPSVYEHEEIINVDGRTKEVTREEYSIIQPMKADISDSAIIGAFGNKSYTFNMSSWTSAPHKRFVTNISNVSSKGNIDFKIIIEEDGEIIYSGSYNRSVKLETTGARDNRKYKVTIVNTSNAEVSYNINIISYK